MRNFILLTTAAFLIALPFEEARSQTGAPAAEFLFRIGKPKELHRVVIALDASAAPGTVANFEKLLQRGFYNKLRIHRVIPDYLLQMGDPLSRKRDKIAAGTGGPGYTLPAEIHRQTVRGSVAMARLPDKINPARRSNGSQF